MIDESDDFLAKLNEQVESVCQHYNRQGERVSFLEWVRLTTENPDYSSVANDVIRQDRHSVEVSTVLIGVPLPGGLFSPNHVNGKPLIFETMVFCDDGNEYTHRYATEADAKAGHIEIVAAIREGRPIKLEDHGLAFKMSMVLKLLSGQP